MIEYIESFPGGAGVLAAYFVDPDASGDERLGAAVVWRIGPRAPGDRAERADPPRRPPPGWADASGASGSREAHYSRARGAVWLLGREYPVPAGRALVLLVDEADHSAPEPVVATHAIDAPPWPAVDLRAGGREGAVHEAFDRRLERCRALVMRDPAVREFLAGYPAPGPRRRRAGCLTMLLALAVLAALGLAAPARAQLTIRLTSVPAGTPAGARIHVAGSFNGWNPGDTAYRLSPEPGGGWAITLPASVAGAIEYKLTLGSWDRVETAAGGADVPNRQALAPRSGAAVVTAEVAGWKDPAAARAPKRSTRTRSVSVLTDSFAIPGLGRARRVWLYLPPDYGMTSRRYPVIYMHDGQNVFDDATSFAGEWGVDETLDSLHALGDRGAIVVAVDNGGTHRMSEYNPWRSADARYGGGEGDEYVDFLVRTLKPWIDRRYRTLPGPAHTAVVGSSMGGLISLYAALEHPEVFGRAGVFSCACWIARPDVYAFARRRAARRPGSRLYFVSGALETADGGPARDQREMADTLLAAGFRARGALRVLAPADGKHAEWFWRREFPAAYRWLFAGGGR